jgi:hypothetical protein
MVIKKVGIISSILTTCFGSLYIFALVLTLLKLIPKPWDTFFQLLPSLLLAWSFISMMACYYKSIDENNNLYAFIGLCFAIIYATINSIVYFTVLTVVIPAILSGQQSEFSLLLFEPGKFLFAINGLAYTLMSLSTLILSLSFSKNKNFTFVKWSLFAHGIIGPFIMGAVLLPILTYIGALWVITFPCLCLASINYFKNK